MAALPIQDVEMTDYRRDFDVQRDSSDTRPAESREGFEGMDIDSNLAAANCPDLEQQLSDRHRVLRREGARLVSGQHEFAALVSKHVSSKSSPIQQLEMISKHSLEFFGRRPLDFSLDSPLSKLFSDSKGVSVCNGLLKVATNPLTYLGTQGAEDGWLRAVSAEEIGLPWVTGVDEEEAARTRAEEEASKAEDMDQEEEDDETPVTADTVLYLREVAVSAEEAINAILNFVDVYPAEIPWGLVMIEQLHQLAKETLIGIKYWGCSAFLTPAGRAAEDEAKSETTRFQHFLKVSKLYSSLRYYIVEFSPEHLRITAPLHAVKFAARENPHFGPAESALISTTPFARLNSALGGFSPTYLPSTSIIDIRDQVSSFVVSQERLEGKIPPLESLTLRAPRANSLGDASTQEDQRALWRQEEADRAKESYFLNLETWRRHNPNFVRPEEFPESDILFNLSAIDVASDGHPKTFSVLKDITEEALYSDHSQHVRFYGSRSGQAAKSWRELFAFLRDDPNICLAQTDPSIEEVTTSLFAFVDLWAIDRDHSPIAIAVICLIRVLLRLDAPVLRIYSAKLAGLFLTLGVNKLFSSAADPIALKKFLDGELDSEGEKVLFDFDLETGTWREQTERDFILVHVGRIFVVPLLPEDPQFEGFNHFRLGISLVHPGALKYDPTFEHVLSDIIALSELKAALLGEICALHRPNTDESSLVTIRLHVEQEADRLGINGLLQTKKMEFLELTDAIRGFRQATLAAKPSLASRDVIESFFAKNEQEKERLKEYSPAPLRPIPNLRTAVAAGGVPHSEERQDQLLHLVTRHNLETRRGLRSSFPPSEHAPGSQSWNSWFLSLAEGTMLWSAFQRNPFEEDEEGWNRVETRYAAHSARVLSQFPERAARHSRDPSNPNHTLSISPNSLITLLVEPTRPRFCTADTRKSEGIREAFVVECKLCHCDPWLVEVSCAKGVSRATHACTIEELGEEGSYRALNEDEYVIAGGGTKTGAENRRKEQRRKLRKFVGLEENPGQFRVFQIIYADQIPDLMGLPINDCLPGNVTAFDAVDLLLDLEAPPLPEPIQQRLDQVTEGGGLKSLNLGYILDIADDFLDRPDQRAPWRRHQALSKVLAELGSPLLPEGTIVTQGTLLPSELYSYTYRKFWTRADRFVVVNKMFEEPTPKGKSLLKQFKKDSNKDKKFLLYLACAGEEVRVEFSDGTSESTKLVCSAQTLSLPHNSATISHEKLANAPPGSIHSEGKQVGGGYPVNPTFAPISSLLQLPRLFVTFLHLERWSFREPNPSVGRKSIKELEDSGIEVLDW